MELRKGITKIISKTREQKKIKRFRKNQKMNIPIIRVSLICKTERFKSRNYFNSKSLFYRLKHDCDSEDKITELAFKIDLEISKRPIDILESIGERILFLIIKGEFYYRDKTRL